MQTNNNLHSPTVLSVLSTVLDVGFIIIDENKLLPITTQEYLSQLLFLRNVFQLFYLLHQTYFFVLLI